MSILEEVQATFGKDTRFALMSLACDKEPRQAGRKDDLGEKRLGWTHGSRRRAPFRGQRSLQDRRDSERVRRWPRPVSGGGCPCSVFGSAPWGRVLGHDLSGRGTWRPSASSPQHRSSSQPRSGSL